MPIEYINNSKTFNYTKTEQKFIVPAGVTSLSVDAYGGSSSVRSGYYARSDFPSSCTGHQAQGGRVETELSVSGGETLYLYVGGQGNVYCSSIGCYPNNSAGGWNGGGNGSGTGEAGGGATHISKSQGLLSTYSTDSSKEKILVVAGGAGGAGGSCYSYGGHGGGEVGENGSVRYSEKATGGSQTAGGAGGFWGGGNGSFGKGGNASGSGGGYGGGGGGGWYGGGGSANERCGGGGGSSYTHPTLASSVKTVHTQGVNLGDGKLILEWSEPKKQQYAISGTVEVGQTLTVAKSGVNNVADSATYKWQSSNDGETEWTDIPGATSQNYTITRGDRYRFLRAEVTYTMTDSTKTLTGNIAHTEKTILVPLEREQQRESKSFFHTFPGSVQTWTVPDRVTSLSVDAYGASGSLRSNNYGGFNSGLGGRVEATLSVSPGEVLYIYVGREGETEYSGQQGHIAPDYAEGGWNGGGSSNNYNGASAGGGATDIRINGQSLYDRVIVAGGGGGGPKYINGRGGAGGGLIGGDGIGIGSGGGGTQTAGGKAGWVDGFTKTFPGSFGTGGNGDHYIGHKGGAGGGGWYGGGGGVYEGGGGGGSSYTNPNVVPSTSVVHTQGVQERHGKLMLEWQEVKTQQYDISGSKVTGAELSVIKNSSDVIVPSVDDQYTTYQWQRSSDSGNTWENISGATSSTFIPNDWYANKQIKVLITYNMKSLVDQVFQVETAAVTMTLFNFSDFESGSVTGTVNFEQTLTLNLTGSGTVQSRSYQWQSSNDGNDGWANINQNGTGNTYQIKGKDQNKYIRVFVTYKADGQEGNRTFPVTRNPSIPVPPFVNQAYTIHESETTVPGENVANSTSQIGKTLSVFTRNDPTVDKDGETDTTYQWQRYDGVSSWNNITGATGKTYAVMGPDENKKLRAKVSFHYSGLGPITVDTTNEVIISAFDMATLEYAISGTVEIGQSLSVTKSGSLPNWMPAITNTQYEWQRRSSNGTDWSAISSETNSVYKVMGPDEGKYLRARVTFTISSLSFTKTLYTESTIAVPDFVLQDYIVTGIAENGRKLTVKRDPNGNTVSNITNETYQWQFLAAVGSEHGWTNVGTDNKIYTVQDQLKDTRVKVTFSVSSLDITKVVTVNVPYPHFIAFGMGKDAVNLDNIDVRGKNLSGINIKSMSGTVVGGNTKFTNANIKGVDMKRIKGNTDGGTITISAEKQEEIDFSRNLRSEYYDLSDKDIRDLDLTGMKITRANNVKVNDRTNLSHINAKDANINLIMTYEDINNDGLVDSSVSYKIFINETTALTIKDGGNEVSKSNPHFKIIKAIATGSGYKVLLEQGSTSKQYKSWDIDYEGNKTQEGDWAQKMSSIGLLETMFNIDLNSDGTVGVNYSDNNGDRLVDGGANYKIFISRTTALTIKDGGNEVSKSNPIFKIIKAIATDSGYKVLLEQDVDSPGFGLPASKQYKSWDIDPAGNKTGGGDWITNVIELGPLETMFDIDLNGDGYIGSPTMASST